MNTEEMYKEFIREKIENNQLWAVIDYRTYLEMLSKALKDS